MDLAGKDAVVTGGSKGMGLSIATRFIRQGAKVAICANDTDSLAIAEAAIDGGSNVLSIFADASRADDVESAMAATVRRFEGIDCLVNSAGIRR